MKSKLSFIITSLALVALVVAGCHSSSSSSGTATRAQVTTGVVTGFGSVFVNGVEFTKKADVTDAQAVTFAFDDSHPGQAGLKIGMIVTVKGTVDPATKTGEFESIEFNPELRGPADSVLTSGATSTLKVMGHDVVTGATTSFEGVTDMAGLTSKLTGTNTGKHPEVEVSGRMGADGTFHATRIAVKSDDFGASGTVALHGKITTAPTTTGGSFTIGNIEVVTTATTSMPNTTTADLVAGASVEVKGTLDANTNTLTATRIEGNKGNHGLGEGVEAEDNVSIQGIASGGVGSDGSFTMNGPNGTVTVKVGGSTAFSGGAGDSSIVTTNAMLEIEGTVQADGSVLATKVKSETEIESESHGGSTETGGGGGETGGGGGTSHA